MAPYPTKAEIEQLCSALASSDTSPFFSRVAPDVIWDVMGTHPAAGHFTSLQAWKDAALGTVQKVLKEPLSLKPTNVVGGGDQEWAAVELEANAVCKNGMPRSSPAYQQPLANALPPDQRQLTHLLGMPYNQRYCWMLRFDRAGTIVQARAYLDSALVQQAVDSNP